MRVGSLCQHRILLAERAHGGLCVVRGTVEEDVLAKCRIGGLGMAHGILGRT